MTELPEYRRRWLKWRLGTPEWRRRTRHFARKHFAAREGLDAIGINRNPPVIRRLGLVALPKFRGCGPENTLIGGGA